MKKRKAISANQKINPKMVKAEDRAPGTWGGGSTLPAQHEATADAATIWTQLLVYTLRQNIHSTIA